MFTVESSERSESARAGRSEPTERALPRRSSRVVPSRPSREDRFEEILECASTLLKEKPVESTTLADVAERLGIRQQALYYYVSSRNELFFHVLAREMDKALRMIDGVGLELTGRARLEAMFAEHIRLIAKRPALFRFFYGSAESLAAGHRQALREREREYVELFRLAVVQVLERGELPPVDPRVAVETILGMATWSYHWIRADHDDIEQTITQMIQLINFKEHQT